MRAGAAGRKRASIALFREGETPPCDRPSHGGVKCRCGRCQSGWFRWTCRRIPSAATCRVLKLSRQSYYRWLRDSITDAEIGAAYRADTLFDAYRDDPEFGYRSFVDEAREAGQPIPFEAED